MAEHLWYAAAAGFEAAREVSVLPQGQRSRGLHGHSFLAQVCADLPAGWAAFQGDEVAALRKRLAQCVAPLDYELLNRQLPQPTDENLARWIRQRIEVPGVKSVGIQSTLDEGADMDANGSVHLWRRYRFEAAHRLPNVPPGHKCARLHGHGFEVIVHALEDAAGRERGIDHERLDRAWQPLQEQFDHACLNDIEGLHNPTSEMIASWIWRRLKPALPRLSRVTVYETASCGAHFDGSSYRIWKDMKLDSALSLKRAPASDPRHRIHGHTYTLRLHLHAPLDEALGWTVDFGEVKQAFKPIFRLLDRQPLHELVEDSDSGTLARWIRLRAAPLLPQLYRVDLYETRGCGALLAWSDGGPALPIQP